jgi:hypothetical protein
MQAMPEAKPEGLAEIAAKNPLAIHSAHGSLGV